MANHSRINKGRTTMDVVCGMEVDPESAAGSHRHAGETYHFCSDWCLKKFQEAPDRYLKGSGSPTGATSRAPESAPGLPAGGTLYTCPMHPEIRQEGPGSCPICGMALEPMAPSLEEGPDKELVDMRRRLAVGTALTLPLLVLSMGAMAPGLMPHRLTEGPLANAIQLVLATPVVLWCGLPFFI